MIHDHLTDIGIAILSASLNEHAFPTSVSRPASGLFPAKKVRILVNHENYKVIVPQSVCLHK